MKKIIKEILGEVSMKALVIILSILLATAIGFMIASYMEGDFEKQQLEKLEEPLIENLSGSPFFSPEMGP